MATGQIETYLVTQMKAFKSGLRKNDAMSVIMPPLSDLDIEDVAAISRQSKSASTN